MKKNNWESDSLTWIHQVREQMKREGVDSKKINQNAARWIKEWGLTVTHPRHLA